MGIGLPIAIAAGGSMLGSLFGPDRQGDIRKALGTQMGNINRHMQEYRDVIGGKRPSVAEEQMRRALAQSASMQQGMAAGARPGQGQVLAQRNAAQQASALQASASGQGALLRAQEQAAARAALGNMLMGLRGQDLQGALGAAQQPTRWEQAMGALAGGAQLFATMSGGGANMNMKGPPGSGY